MEFDEMKKVWDAQNSQSLFTIDEKLVLKRIQSEMKTVMRFTNTSGWLLIIIYLAASCVLLGVNRFRAGTNIFLYFEAVWMLAIVLYLIISLIRNIKAGQQFDRSILGDLDHSISLTSYQIRVSQIIRWNFLPMGVIMIFSGWEAGTLFKTMAVILVSYALAFYVTSKGYQANKKRKRALQALKEKLETGN